MASIAIIASGERCKKKTTGWPDLIFDFSSLFAKEFARALSFLYVSLCRGETIAILWGVFSDCLSKIECMVFTFNKR